MRQKSGNNPTPALSKVDAHTLYALRFNTVHRTSGHVWQGRSYSTPMDGAHLWADIRTGRPVYTPQFLTTLETRLGRRH